MSANIRQERIEKLLQELRYEVERGMINHEIDETLGFEFYVPISSVVPNGVVFCQFRTLPIPHYMTNPRDGLEPRLKVIPGGKS